MFFVKKKEKQIVKELVLRTILENKLMVRIDNVIWNVYDKGQYWLVDSSGQTVISPYITVDKGLKILTFVAHQQNPIQIILD